MHEAATKSTAVRSNDFISYVWILLSQCMLRNICKFYIHNKLFGCILHTNLRNHYFSCIWIHTNMMSVCSNIFGQESEEFLSSLVVNKTIYAKVDRLAGIINFQRPKDPNDLLNDWSHKLNSLMSLVNKTTHLIAKEEMIHNLQWNIVHYFVFWFIFVYVFPSVGMFLNIQYTGGLWRQPFFQCHMIGICST